MKDVNRIIIVDDHKLFREGLNMVISNMQGFILVGEAPDSYTFLDMLDNTEVDIVLMDISLPGLDGISATEMALKKKPGLKIVALTMFCDSVYYTKMVEAGVVGYILKDSGKDELTRALKSVASGEKYYSQKLLYNIILNTGASKSKTGQAGGKTLNISPKESEILKLICQGYSNNQISKLLAISNRSLEEYRASLISKAGVKDSLNLAIFAVRNNLVEL